MLASKPESRVPHDALRHLDRREEERVKMSCFYISVYKSGNRVSENVFTLREREPRASWVSYIDI